VRLGEAGARDLRRDVGAGARLEDEVKPAEERRDGEGEQLGAAPPRVGRRRGGEVVGARQRRGRGQDAPAA
jgi:hypothetical protein